MLYESDSVSKKKQKMKTTGRETSKNILKNSILKIIEKFNHILMLTKLLNFLIKIYEN